MRAICDPHPSRCGAGPARRRDSLRIGGPGVASRETPRHVGGIALVVGLLTVLPARGEDWPQWRGPRGDGTSTETDLPLTWSATENIAWKAEVPGRGYSSPTVWGDRVLLTTCLEQEQKHVTLCYDRRNGKLLWEHALDSRLQKSIHARNSHATATVATDGRHAYVTFLDHPRFVVCCYDLEGKPVWQRSPGEFHSQHGFGSSPLLHGDLLILNGDQDHRKAFLAALDKETGEEKWRADRSGTRSYTPPVVFDVGGRKQLVLSGSKGVDSYDPNDGSSIWHMDGPTEQYVASLVYHRNVLFMTYGFPKLGVMGINPDGAGNVTKTHVLYNEPKGGGYVPSPIAHGEWFFNVNDNGIATCRECRTGDLVWIERLGGRLFSASATGWGDYICFPDNDGNTFVIKAGPKYEPVAKNVTGEPINASIAVSRGQLFLRDLKRLYCIGAGPARQERTGGRPTKDGRDASRNAP